MKRIHCLRYGGESGALGELIAAADSRSLRVGFLDLEAEEPVNLYEAREPSWAKTVWVGKRANLVLKRRRGPWVLKDVLREYFRGFDLVLVKGEVEFPELSAVDGEWCLTFLEKEKRLSTSRLLDRLARVSLK